MRSFNPARGRVHQRQFPNPHEATGADRPWLVVCIVRDDESCAPLIKLCPGLFFLPDIGVCTSPQVQTWLALCGLARSGWHFHSALTHDDYVEGNASQDGTEGGWFFRAAPCRFFPLLAVAPDPKLAEIERWLVTAHAQQCATVCVLAPRNSWARRSRLNAMRWCILAPASLVRQFRV